MRERETETEAETEKDSTHMNEERAERGREGIPSRLCTVSAEKPNEGLYFMNSEIMT